MIIPFNKFFTLIIGTCTIVVAGWFGYGHWQNLEQQKRDWAILANEFQSCDLTLTLWRLGKPDIAYSTLFENLASGSELTKILTEGYRDKVIKGLDDVWIDPSIQYSLSSKQSTTASVNLLSRCNTKIKQGKLKLGLSLAYYYLYTGHPDSVELLKELGDKGVTDAFVLLGHAYRRGIASSVKDDKLAFAYYLKAAHRGSIKGMLNAAELLQSVDFEKSKKYVIAAAEEGSMTAAFMLQDPNGVYRMTKSGDSRSENDVKVLYFWSLVFTSLKSEIFKEDISLSLDRASESPFLREDEQMFEFDGVPNRAWNGESTKPDTSAKIINNYREESVIDNIGKLESMLDSNSRIQVQGKAKQWMADLDARTKVTNNVRSLPDSDSKKIPAFTVKKPSKVEV